MAYLMQITRDGSLKEIELQKKITTLGPSKEADLYFPSTRNEPPYFQIVEKNKNFQILGLTPHSYFLHQGKKKQALDLAAYEVFEIENFKFIFSKKPFHPEKDTQNILNHYQTFYRFSQTLSEFHHPKAILKKLLDLILDISKAQKGFLLSIENQEKLDEKFKIVASKSIQEKLIQLTLEDLSQSVLKEAEETLSPVIIDNISEGSKFNASNSLHRLELSSIACFPLMAHKKCIGFLYLGSQNAESFFDPFTVQMIQVFLSQASLILENSFLIEKLEKEKRALTEKLENTTIIGTSSVIQDLFQKIEKIAPLDLAVLILGETGTGKEMVAREIHRRSPRGEKPFVAINCGAIPENLLESILFGHKKGSFTGAIEDKMGKFEAANHGTIFLDEIAEMPLRLQVKLLRVLQEKVIERVGDLKEIPIDVRIIAATHQNVDQMIKEGKFREDLFYRLNEIYLHIPPLREREGDILLLAHYFLEKHKEALGGTQKHLTQKAQEKLLHYRWPGNIRELENVIKRTLVFSNGLEIQPEHIEIKSSTSDLTTLKEAKDRFQKDFLRKVLALYDGDKAKVAQALGISIRTLFRIESE